MPPTQPDSLTPPVAAGNNGTNKMVIILAVLVVILLISNVGLLAVILNNQNKSNVITPPPPPVTTDLIDEEAGPVVSEPASGSSGIVTPPNTTRDFSSSRYNVKFTYPAEMGEATARYQEQYFKNENVTFANSKITVSYWRFEGAVGDGGSDVETVVSKDGKSFRVDTIVQGVNNEQRGVFAIAYDPKNSAASVMFLVQGLPNDAEAAQQRAIIKQIISTLSFDLATAKI